MCKIGSYSPISGPVIQPDKNINNTKTDNIVKFPEKNVQENTVINDENKLNKILSKDFDNAFNFKPKSKLEGGEGGLTSANPDSLSAKFYPQTPTTTNNKGLGEKVNLDSREDRVKFTNSTTQLESSANIANEYGCGPSCIVNGAMMQGGKEGLNNLVKVIKDRGKDSCEKGSTVNTVTWKQIPGWDKLDGIEDRIKNNNVTRQDLLDLQKIVYGQIRHMEGPNTNGGDGTVALNIDKVRDYINTDTSTFGGRLGATRPLQSTFSNMNIKLMDTDGNRANSEHFTLFFNTGGSGAENAVFDPWPRTSGNQIVKDPAELGDYHKSVLNAVR